MKFGVSLTPSKRTPLPRKPRWRHLKLIVSYFVGGRDGECAMWFMDDLASRLTNGLSKKVESYAFAIALHIMYYNFVRIHSTLRMPPAMAAGVSDRLWEISDIVALVEAEEAKTIVKRGLNVASHVNRRGVPAPIGAPTR
jgi:hypothetical protein